MVMMISILHNLYKGQTRYFVISSPSPCWSHPLFVNDVSMKRNTLRGDGIPGDNSVNGTAQATRETKITIAATIGSCNSSENRRVMV